MFGDITQHVMLRAEKEREKYATLSTKLVNQQQYFRRYTELSERATKCSLIISQQVGQPCYTPFKFELLVAAPKDIPLSRCGPLVEKVGHPMTGTL